MKISKEYLEYCNNIIIHFYEDIDNLNFNDLSEERIVELYNIKDSLLEKKAIIKLLII